jgi:heme-degrading monooxygenase HmoA
MMVKIVEMDESVTLKAQLEEDVGPVILLNKFTVKPEDTDEFLKVFSLTTEMFKQQPGFISASLLLCPKIVYHIENRSYNELSRTT